MSAPVGPTPPTDRVDAATLDAALSAALGRASGGEPELVVVEGAPGTGKSAALDRLMAAARDTSLLYGCGRSDGDPPAYDLLEQYGTEPVPERCAPPMAAQMLRRAVDAAGQIGPGPVLLVVDDLQWADPESVDALVHLLRRARGDRLLVVATTRPLGPGTHPALQRRLDTGLGRRLTLTGLDLASAGRLADRLRPELGAAVAESLWRHTGGNPLFLRSLLERTDLDLAAAAELPAPDEYGRQITDRWSRLAESARETLLAMCVLTESWLPETGTAAIGVSPAPGDLALLERAGLLLRRPGEVGIPHALTRAAVLQAADPDAVRTLHRRAAAISDGAAALDHRIAATEGTDDLLADDLAAAAQDLHDRGAHRSAARRYLQSARLCTDPAPALLRRYESMVDTLLQPTGRLSPGDAELLAAHAGSIPAAVVTGLAELAAGQWTVGYRKLRQATGIPGSGREPRPDPEGWHYRYAVLLAWAGMASDAATSDVERHLSDAVVLRGRPDPAFTGEEARVRGYLTERRLGVTGARELFAGLPDDPVRVPTAASLGLLARGVTGLRLCLLDEAIADLGELRRRVEDGAVSDISNGAFFAALACSLWLRGEWDRAAVIARQGTESFPRYEAPHLAAAQSMIASVRGDLAAADTHLGRARAFLADHPWPEPERLLLNAEVVRVLVDPDPAARHRFRPDHRVLRRMLGNRAPALWEVMFAAQALLWLDDPVGATTLIDTIGRDGSAPAWAGAVRDRLAGLVREAAGDLAGALGLLERAGTGIGDEVPWLRALTFTDLARLRHRSGAAAGEAAAEARRWFRLLGAPVPADVDRWVTAPAGPAGPVDPAPVRDSTPGWQLSEREREVLALVIQGLSHQQTARELFVTRSTVNFHLGNIYAKVGVSSRHDLTAMVRSDPAAFGILLR
ncbi:LuxR C-terminal-related transcriptional regulator [Nakamurella alba]|nr:LuxR C-terminal-related transcriptional regulator [Nakamurella alba]